MSSRRASRRAALAEAPAPPRAADHWRHATVRACAAGLVASFGVAAVAGVLLAQAIPGYAAALVAIVLAAGSGAADARRILLAIRERGRGRREDEAREGKNAPLGSVRVAVRARGKQMKVVRAKK